MKLTHHKFTIVVEVLDSMAVPAMIQKAANCIRSEVEEGMMSMNDGDKISWSVEKKEVEIK